MGSMRSNKKAAAKSQFIHLYGAKLRSDVIAAVKKSNEAAQPERRVSVGAAITAANRDLANTLSYSSNVRYFSAVRAVNAFLALATRNKQTPQSLSNADLLPVGHPASTRSHAMTASALLHAQARWIAADPMVDDSVRSLVASAHAARPGSIERAHAFTRLSLIGFGKAPNHVLIDEARPAAVTASLFLVGKNSSAARRLRAQMQRRDRRGRFAEMGGGWSFNLRLPSGLFKAVSGRVVGASGDDGVEIEVRGNRHLPDGVYTMPSSKGEGVAAILSEEAVKDLPDIDVYVGTDDVFADSDDLIASRKDAPSGWSRAVTGEYGNGAPSRLEWTNEETGYSVTEYLNPDGTREGALDLRRGLDNKDVARGKSWGDIQKAIDKDQPEYLKKIAEYDQAEAAKSAPAQARGENVVDGVRLPAGQKKLKPWQQKIIGPRKVGGRYRARYGGEEYEVLDIYVDDNGQVKMRVRGADGYEREHSTAWEKGDTVVSEPPIDLAEAQRERNKRYDEEEKARDDAFRKENEKREREAKRAAKAAKAAEAEREKIDTDSVQKAIDAGEEISFM